MKNLFARFQRKDTESAAAPTAPPESSKEKAAPIEPARLQTAVARAVKPSWHAPGAVFPQKGKGTPVPAERALAAEMFTLRLGDFLDRIPPELLDAGTPDRTTPMPFDLAALSERIGRGETTIRLAEVYRRMPDIFRTDKAIDQDCTIPFPWKKVLAMIQEAKAGAAAESGVTRAGVDALALKFKARKLRQPVKTAPVPAVAGEAEKAGPASRAETAPWEQQEPLRLAATAAGELSPAHAEALAQVTAERDVAVARMAEFDTEYESMIGRTGELTSERDAAVARVAELTAERDAALALAKPSAEGSDAAAARVAELMAERDAAVARAEKLFADSEAAVALAAELTTERDAAKSAAAALATERDAAKAEAATISGERDAAVARGSALAAEREALAAQLAAMTAEREAARARAAEPTDESKTAAARVAEITAERDAAVARTAKLFADSEASVALATELTDERNAAQAQLAALHGQLDAATARAHELTAERDAAAARAAELLQKSEVRAQAPEPAPAAADEGAAIVGFRNTIAALIHERDELRAENLQLAGPRTKRHQRLFSGKNAPVPPAPVELLPDVYSALFPRSVRMQRGAAIVVLGLLALGIVCQTTPEAGIAPSAPAVEPAAPALAQTDAEEPGLALEAAPSEDAAPALSSETPAEETADAAQPAGRKTVTSRRAR